ncbi:MAG: PKD domain-containing protein [Candidatus Falkowbacteria bacterium]|nr:PKD domain-containing protein [Candidatus Falkowbacteria bacterium]
MKKQKILNRIQPALNLIIIVMLIGFVSLSTSCKKTYDNEPVIPANDWQIMCKNVLAVGDTFHFVKDIVATLWIEGPSGVSAATWNFGDGTATVSGQMVTHLWSTDGIYIITAVFTPIGGSQITKTAIVKIGLQGASGNCLVLLSSSIVTGTSNYNYNMAAWPGTISNYVNIPGYPWWCGTTPGWIPQTSITTTITLNNQTWLPFSFERINGEEVMQYGRGNNWSLGTGYAYWQPDGSGGGTYHLNCQNGHVYNGPQPAFEPGLTGDPFGTSVPPTIRYDFETNPNQSLSDSLVIYFNNIYGGNNINPFVKIKYSTGASWALFYQKFNIAEFSPVVPSKGFMAKT